MVRNHTDYLYVRASLLFVYLLRLNYRFYGPSNRPVKFVNIKLPNDSFFYTTEHANSGGLAVSDSTMTFLRSVFTSILKRGILPGT
jgi:hypothetical protein